jgi:hypothetical protein
VDRCRWWMPLRGYVFPCGCCAAVHFVLTTSDSQLRNAGRCQFGLASVLVSDAVLLGR